MLPDKAERLIKIMQGTEDPVNDLERAFLEAFLLETNIKATYEDIDHLLVKFDIINIMDSKEGMVLLGLMVGKKTNIDSLKLLADSDGGGQIH